MFLDMENNQTSGEHMVNYIIVHYAIGTTFVFEDYDACLKFCKFLFSIKHKWFVVIAHNMKEFDGQFVLHWVIR